MKRIAMIKRTTLAGLLALTLGVVTTAPTAAAPLALSDVPLFVDLAIEPNIVVSMDSSGSMKRCFILPGGVDTSNFAGVAEQYTDTNGKTQYKAYLGVTSPDVNSLYYNPNIEYVLPVDGNGVALPLPSFTNAPRDGYYADPTSGTTSLNTSFKPCWNSLTSYLDPRNRASPPNPPPPVANRPAYWYEYIGPTPASTSDLRTDSNFILHEVGTATDPSFGGNNTKQKQNFAIWYSYYRNRIDVMKSTASLAFADPTLDARVRIAYQNLWGFNTGGGTTKSDIGLMKKYTGQARVDFYNWMFRLTGGGSTPLRYTTNKVGLYYMNKHYDSSGNVVGIASATDSPWAFEPGVTKDPEYACRQAFQVLMTDGLWNGDAGVSGNQDGTSVNYGAPGAVALPSGATSYSPMPPYTDSEGDKLADTAFYYWVSDLRPDLPNTVPTFMPDPTGHPLTGKVEDNPKNDPATWQHMVNYFVSFGVAGNLPLDSATYDKLLLGSANGGVDWPGSSEPGYEVDDLWHAAIDSRGQYLSARNPQDLVDAFTSSLNAVLARTSSGAGVAVTSGSLGTDTQLFQGRFNTGNWTGRLLAFDLNPTTGFLINPETWDGAVTLTNQVKGSGWDSSRTVVTFDGTGGVPFRWGSISAGMQADLNKNGLSVPDVAGAEQGEKRLEYLRGSEADEGPNGQRYRARLTKLGDIVSSAPVFVGAPAFSYPDNLESSAYSAFKTNNSSRTPMVYIGANDGMLHGFDASKTASAGAEKIAYVPKAVYPRLTRLTATNYAHRFFVDGTPTVGDAFWAGAWHTVLVGGLNHGGQAIYALDVTNPANFSEANAASTVLWEFSDANKKDLGYTYSRPAIVRLHNNKWAVVFGNGYNNTESDGGSTTSSTGDAILYILDISNGSVISEIDTGVGLSDPASNGHPNGLATVAPVDIDGNHTIDLIYAGDLYGNLWKFDVRNSIPANWTKTKLFTAKDAGGNVQAITVRPEVGKHPDPAKPGFMVYFGTGKYLESGDNVTASTQTQTFWGIWDPDNGSTPPYARNKLLQQQILEEVSVNVNGVVADARITTDNAITWAANPQSPGASEHIGWYMDLVNTNNGVNTDPKGERQVTNPILRNGRIIFTTLIPSGSSCVFGGAGWLMELDAADGSRLGAAPFDIDGDGVFDLATDSNGNKVVMGGLRSTVGAPSEPTILDRGNNTEVKTISGSNGGSMNQWIENSPPPGPPTGSRESWQQLQ